jgi:hypothetical protein
MGRVTKENLEKVMTYNKPDAEQVKAHGAIQKMAIEACLVIIDNVPECADRTTAINLIRQARERANAAIALRGEI